MYRGRERYYRIRDVGLKPNNEPALSAWVQAVQWAAKAADPPPAPMPGPWSCTCTFWFVPPDSRIGQQYAIGQKKEAEGTTTNVGDQDKLLRAVLDALQGIFWVDDRHVCDGGVTKLYCHKRDPGAVIVVRFLEDEQLCLL